MQFNYISIYIDILIQIYVTEEQFTNERNNKKVLNGPARVGPVVAKI